MTDEELKALAAANTQSIADMSAYQQAEGRGWRQGLDELKKFQQTEAREWRARLDRENAEWKDGISDAINHMIAGFEDQGSRIDQLGEYIRAVSELVATLSKEGSARQDRTDFLFRDTWQRVAEKFSETEIQLQALIDMAKENTRQHQDWRERWDSQTGGTAS